MFSAISVGRKRSKRRFHAVLHVHGGGSDGSPRLAAPFWATPRRYACLSFDFCGNTSTFQNSGLATVGEHYTRWGKAPADMMKIGAGTQMTPTPRHNPWYHWTLAARRGLTLLEHCPEVDGNKLGVFGISVGGTLTWSHCIGRFESKGCCPYLRGCGWEFYQYPPDLTASVGDDLKMWR